MGPVHAGLERDGPAGDLASDPPDRIRPAGRCAVGGTARGRGTAALAVRAARGSTALGRPPTRAGDGMSDVDPLIKQSATEMARAVREREVSPVELVQAHID